MSDDTQRVAVVTGASRGIGKAIAQRLAADGRHVVCVARSEGPLKELVETIRSAGGSAEHVTCDLSDGESVGAMIDDVVERCGRVDVLIRRSFTL